MVFHGVLRDPKQVTGLPVDARIGKEFMVTIIGDNTFQSKDLPMDTVEIKPSLAEILAPSDTSVTEGDFPGFSIRIRNPLQGPLPCPRKKQFQVSSWLLSVEIQGKAPFPGNPALIKVGLKPTSLTPKEVPRCGIWF